MGFNNGYESGYDDAKAESAQKIKALEARITELEASGGASTPSVPMLKLDGSNVKGEIVWPGGTAQYADKFTTIQANENVERDEETGVVIVDEIIVPTIDRTDIFIVSTAYTGDAVPQTGGGGFDVPVRPGVYVFDSEGYGSTMIAPLYALVL